MTLTLPLFIPSTIAWSGLVTEATTLLVKLAAPLGSPDVPTEATNQIFLNIMNIIIILETSFSHTLVETATLLNNCSQI
jgi:hypothetical protein